jgi:hypothetical protein
MTRSARRWSSALASFLAACLAGLAFTVVVSASPASAAQWWPRNIANTANAQIGKGCSSFPNACAWQWCSLFTKWVWSQNGVPYTNEIDAYAASVWRYGQKYGTLSTTKPHKGDIAVFLSTGGDPGVWAEHVAIVTAVNGGDSITTVGGNEGGTSPTTSSVKSRTHSNWRAAGIRGFVSPAGMYQHLYGRYSEAQCISVGSGGVGSGQFFDYSCRYNGYYGNWELWALY